MYQPIAPARNPNAMTKMTTLHHVELGMADSGRRYTEVGGVVTRPSMQPDLDENQRKLQARANSAHSPGTPFNVCAPRAVNSRPDPTTRSLTVLETSTSSAPALAAT